MDFGLLTHWSADAEVSTKSRRARNPPFGSFIGKLRIRPKGAPPKKKCGRFATKAGSCGAGAQNWMLCRLTFAKGWWAL